MTALCFTDAPQIDELPECWTSEEIDLYLETEEPEEEEGPGWDLYGWDDDQALEEYSLECCFGPEE